MLFLSQLIGQPVRDRDGEAFGKVRDSMLDRLLTVIVLAA